MPCAVILTALRVEYLAVCQHLTHLQKETHEGYQQGNFTSGERDWVVNVCEIGAGNSVAALEAGRAISYFNPDVILFVGVAGGIKDVKIGDVVAATKIYGYESGKALEGFNPRPEVALSTNDLVIRARVEARKPDWHKWLKNGFSRTPEVLVAPIAAGEKVVASTESDAYKLIKSSYGDAVALEMEGFGFLKAAHANQHVSAMVVRGISDLIDGKSQADGAGSQEIASAHASAFAFQILAELNLNDDNNFGEVPKKVQLDTPLPAQEIFNKDMNIQRLQIRVDEKERNRFTKQIAIDRCGGDHEQAVKLEEQVRKLDEDIIKLHREIQQIMEENSSI